MIQTRKTGSTISCLRPRTADRARLPVTMPRNSDSDMCRAGQSIASMQSDTGLDEHGRLHGVSDLSNDFADLRTSASNSWSFSAKERKRRWRILAQKRSQIRRPDKARFLAAGALPLSICLHIVFWWVSSYLAKWPGGATAVFPFVINGKMGGARIGWVLAVRRLPPMASRCTLHCYVPIYGLARQTPTPNRGPHEW